MPESTLSAAVRADGRDQFRAAVAALPAGPLRDVLVAVAYARDAAARAGAPAAPRGRAGRAGRRRRGAAPAGRRLTVTRALVRVLPRRRWRR
jgi:hypothetical protein